MWNPFEAEGYLKAISAGLGVLMAGGGGMYTAYQWHDSTYAQIRMVEEHRAELLLVEMRLDQKILNDRLNALQFRIWKMEERYGPQMNLAHEDRDEAAIAEYRALMMEKQELERQLGNIESRIMQQQYQYRQGATK